MSVDVDSVEVYVSNHGLDDIDAKRKRLVCFTRLVCSVYFIQVVVNSLGHLRRSVVWINLT
jgi:hypothetical protein